MKRNSKLFSCIFASCLMLTGCSSSGGGSDDSSTSEVSYEDAQGQTYTIGTDTTFAPFEYEDENGNHVGIDIDLLNAVADEMGFTVDWEVLGFSASVTALEAGQVDAVMAGMSITDERKEKYDFTDSYYDCSIAVGVAQDSDIDSLDDLEGQSVVIKTGTTSAQYAYDMQEEYGYEIIEVEESATMYTYIESGQAAACFEDYPILQYEINRGNIDLKVIHESDSDNSYPTGMAVLKGEHPELIAAFNEGLSRLQEDGTYDSILESYFGETD